MKHLGQITLLVGLVLLFSLSSCSSKRTSGSKGYGSMKPIKREFRGAWLPTIYRKDYAPLSRNEAKALLRKRIALLHNIGCNAVLFQVRAEGDAWYQSSYEPWSRFLVGREGISQDPGWDPLAFVIEECHLKGMEVHAWINPYRGSSDVNIKLAPEHLASKHPEWFVRYNNQLILDPGRPQGRKHICLVIKDLVQRYDVDALHLDDYFYPYPVSGEVFEDDETFKRYGVSVGYTADAKDKWRRNNINLLIHDIKRTLLQTKSWVRLGISPFGIYRNQSNDRGGSATTGLQAYDDLHADVLHWVREGWVDYIAPQLYWNIGTKVADYEVLTQWWSQQVADKTQLYIGQDIRRTMTAEQLDKKLILSRTLARGNIWWPGDELLRNHLGISENLKRSYYRTKALLPEYKDPTGRAQTPEPIYKVWEDSNEDGHMLMWEDLHLPDDPSTPFYYAVYAFADGERADHRRPNGLVAITTNPYYKLPRVDGRTQYTFLVTAINRFWQESKPFKLKVFI